jgi:hypothetical protein
MNSTSSHWAESDELIESFLLHRLVPDEENEFVRHLAECESCRFRVSREREIVLGIRSLGRLEMKRSLNERLRKTKDNSTAWIQAVSIAAAVLFVVVGALLLHRATFGEKERNREIVFQKGTDGQAFWMIGNIIPHKIALRTRPVQDASPWILRHDGIMQNFVVKYAAQNQLTEQFRNRLDHNSMAASVMHTQEGLQLTFFPDSLQQNASIGILPISDDSLIVEIQGKQFGYCIPGGWGKMM